MVAEGYRALAASLVAIIIIYRASSPTLSLVPTIILVRTTPRPSAGTLPLPLPRVVLRKSNWFPEFIARQIFPLSSRLHGRPNTRAMVYRYRPGVYARRATHIRSRYVRDWSIAYKFSTNNKSACGTRCRRPLHIPECENSAETRSVPRESSRILQYVSSRWLDCRDFCNCIVTNSWISLQNYVSTIDRFFEFLHISCN